jgi:uncharacterized lipoprotein NlpE involved in copper resistance
MKNTISTLILALLLFSGCGNTAEQYTPQEEVICKIHYLNCNKLAKDENMSLDEYHKWQEEQEKAAQDEDNATNENGDIVDPQQKVSINLRLFLFSAHFFSQNYSVNSFFKFKMGVLK